MTTTHHPSCPQRITPGAGCGTGSDGHPCSPAYLCPACIELLEAQLDLDPQPLVCICGPDAQPEPEWMGHEPRTAEDMAYAIGHAAAQARVDRLGSLDAMGGAELRGRAR